MLRVRLILSVFLIFSLAGPLLADSAFNVDCFLGWGGCYRPMEWTPVEISVSSTLTEPFAGSLTISAQQDGLNTLSIAHTFVLTPDVPLYIPLVTKLAFAADKCKLRIIDERGRTRWRYDFELWNFSTRSRALTAVGESDLLVGLVGRRKFGLLRLPQQSICKSDSGGGKVYLKDKIARMVPWDWTGFVCLDLLILYDPDWSLFKQNQLNAIVQWVSNGGRLLLVLGSRPLDSGNPIAQMLPFEVQQARQTAIAPETLGKWKLNPAEREDIVCWALKPKPDACFYQTDGIEGEGCLFGTGYVGFGRVGVLAFDPSTMTDRQKSNSTRFWVSRIAAILEDAYKPSEFGTKEGRREVRRRPDRKVYRGLSSRRSIELAENAEGNPADPSSEHMYNIGPAQAGNNAVMEYLYSISELRPLSIWWVILLLALLAVLLGPVDYTVLKRIGRLPLTWITCSLWIILFSVGAYYGVQALRSGKMQLRVVSVLDGIEGSDYAWSTAYCGLFAPYSDAYQLKGLGERQWWSGIAPVQEHVYAYGRQIGSRNIYCFQYDGGNLPYSLPINIWTMQCLLNESPLQQLPISAEVQQRGDELILSITNLSENPIKKGYVLLNNNQALVFGFVGAGSTGEFSGKPKGFEGWDYDINSYVRASYNYNESGLQSKFKNETAYLAQGCLQRTQTIKAYLAHGAAVVCAEFDQAPVSFGVKARSCDYNHIQLVRLVVFPKPG